jgi:methylated-DNA-[protein]-cysteine S-methyltransferase
VLRATVFRSPWGWMGIAESTKGICAISLPQSTRHAAESTLRAAAGPFMLTRSSPRLRTARVQLLRYLGGTGRSFALPLDVGQGTPFQQRVWRVLQGMPYGTLRSYRWVADRIGGRRYARAVGNAVGANPIPIVIPCHRIISGDASLGGFSGGLSVKRRLLRLEGSLAQIRR